MEFKRVTISGIPEELLKEFNELFKNKKSMILEHRITQIIKKKKAAPQININRCINFKKGKGRVTIPQLPLNKYEKIVKIAKNQGFKNLSPFLVEIIKDIVRGSDGKN